MLAKGPLFDNSVMPWGIHKGKRMINVPAKYLLFLFDNGKCSDPFVRDYIIENIEVLRSEAREKTTYNQHRS